MKSRTGVERIEATAEPLTHGTVDATADGTQEATTLEELSAAYAKLLSDQNPEVVAISASDRNDVAATPAVATEDTSELLSDQESSAQPVEPQAIIEAMLFVGHPDNVPLKSEFLARTMRGIDADDVVEAIAKLNATYREREMAMEIVAVDGGYRLQVSSALDGFRNQVNAKVRESQLNQSAIDCLSLVAYQPGTTREEIERLWGRPAGSVLSLLVRRDLLRVDKKADGRAAQLHYYPTERFLNLVGIASLDDLPTVDGEE